MSAYAHIKRCLELSDRDIASAVTDRRTAKALLDQLAKVSRPGDGAPKLLLVFAKLATSDVDWIDGGLRVEMNGDAEETVVEVLTELGLGMHERIFPSFKMAVPLEEFARAVERVPHMIAPLTLSGVTSRRIVLTAIAEEEEDDVVAPSAVPIDDESLYGSAPRRRSSKDKIAVVKAPGTQIQPRSSSTSKHPAARKTSRPRLDAVKPKSGGKSVRPPSAGEPSATGLRVAPRPASVGRVPVAAPAPAAAPAGSMPKIIRASIPRPPALPRTDEHTPAPGPSPLAARSAIAKVPLARIQVSRPSAAGIEKPKRTSVRPQGKSQSKPPERRSKTPPPRGAAPKSARGGRTGMSEPPDQNAIDTGWGEEPED
jgi:hypothetical protein